MKKIIFSLGISITSFVSAQHKDSTSNKLYVKANALFLPIGMLNAGLEYQTSKKTTLQGDVFISPWKSFMGNHAQFYIGLIEYRYYFSKAFHKWYLGVNLGGSVFDIQKWNYRDTNQFQRGFSILAGATVGYQMNLTDRWNLDFYLGGGTSQGFYHGYDETDPNNLVLYYEDSRKWNKSGEWIPYRGGVMISYQLK